MASLRDCAILDRACNTGVDHQLAEIDRRLGLLAFLAFVHRFAELGVTELRNRRGPLIAAEAWCWAARMLGNEADAIDYAWRSNPCDREQSDELHAQADALYARAKALDGSRALWKRALAKFDAPAALRGAQQ